MTDAPLPQNIFRLTQKAFDAIPSGPWVYWVSDYIRELFINLPNFGRLAKPVQGLITGDNERFIRFWWEVSGNRLIDKGGNWTRYARGGITNRWFGNQDSVVNWHKDGHEIKNLITSDGARLASRPQNQAYYFKEGMTFNRFAKRRFAARWLQAGLIFDCNSPSAFGSQTLSLLAFTNSTPFSVLCGLINPTLNFQVGDVERTPVQPKDIKSIGELSTKCIRKTYYARALVDETAFNFVAPPLWPMGLQDLADAQLRLSRLEAQIDDEVYHLYGISDKDRVAIEVELAGGLVSDGDEESAENINEEVETIDAVSTMAPQEMAVRWVSYVIGILLERFRPGVTSALGSAIYYLADLTIGSLPTPDEAEFDELVGPPERFAYIDDQGGRHVFSAEVERLLQELALPDGIAVFDEGHPRDLAGLVERALVLMLGEQGAAEVIQTIDEGRKTTGVRPPSLVLRQFLEKDFFISWHVKWYRKRPVYWPIQSSKRSYGFVLFHEKISHDTFYAIQRAPYLDTKRNAVALKMADLQASLARATGAARKKLEKELDDLRKLSDELAEFAKELEAITLGGYEPEQNWIDDGVILRMAPLWKVIPIWKSEPKKYWARLEKGDFDWSHIAMRYWPERVREKCKTNKSYAIAHGHEEWYEGG